MANLADIIASVFQMDPADIGDDSGPRMVGAWTSLGHLEHVAAIQRAFAVTFSPREIRSSTTTTLHSSNNPVKVGVAGNLIATVKNVSPARGIPTGTVTFTVDGVAQPGVPLSARQAKLALSTLSAGTHSIIASYSGDANHAASTSTTLVEVVKQ
jgi:acyl carrier protein